MSAYACSCENFQRLEDFPDYTSVIRCFGKPIIPPLLTPQERLKISQLRETIFQDKKTSEISRKPASKQKNADQCFFQSRNDIVRYHDLTDQHVSAFNVLNSQKSKGNVPSNEMFMSMSKIESSGVCSTVHNDVIVCPNEAKKHNDVNYSTEFETSCSTSEYAESLEENGCDCQECQTQTIDVPYGNACEEQMQSVSEDDQESVTDGADFASLPTVICNQKTAVLDTDSESVVTCMTQSTDLDKYLDCPIEYSSADDGTIHSQSQSSNQRSISSRSDDASTETIINTDSGPTPSISAIADSLYDYERLEETEGTSATTLTSDTMFDENINSRAYSVDSYMKVLRNCATNLYLKKSQSEPSQQIANKLQTSLPSNGKYEFMKVFDDAPSEIPSNEDIKRSELSSENLSFKTSDTLTSETELTPEELSDRKHIRRNSYTLTHPSEALIMAHAKSQAESSAQLVTTSCSSTHTWEQINSAFKKEAVELVLPPLPDREKMFPILKNNDVVEFNSDKSIFSNANHSNEIKAVNNEDIFDDQKPKYSNSNDASSLSVTLEDIQVCLDDGFPSLTDELPALGDKSTCNLGSKTIQNIPLEEGDVVKNNKDNFLTTLFKELKESHQQRVNQLMEEQKIQWLKLQEEFKQQEKVLLEKLSSSGISLPPSQSDTQLSSFGSDFESSDACDPNSSNEISKNLTSSDSNSTNLSSETETFQTVIQKDLDQTNISELPQSSLDSLSSTSVLAVQKYNVENSNDTSMPKQRNTENNNIFTSSKIISDVSDNHACETGRLEHSSCPSSSNFKPSFQGLENLTSLKNNSISSLSRKDNSYMNGQVNNTSFHKVSFEESNFSVNSNLQSYPVKHVYEFPRKIPSSTHLKGQYLESRSCSLEKGSFNLVEGLSSETNMQNICSNGNLIANVPGGSMKKLCANSSCTAAKSKCITNKNSHFDMSNSCVSKINFNNSNPSAISQENQAIKSAPQKWSFVPEISTKAIKLVSSSLTNLRRKQSKEFNPEMMKRFEKLPALVKGYLTRRLFKTERVQGLILTMQETVVLMQNLSDELTLKGNSISERDMAFYNQLLAQLLSTFEEVYDIFCTISTKERMKIISESREYRQKKKALEKKKDASDTDVVIDRPVSQSIHKPKVSSATLKRRKRSLVDNRTYTISDLKDRRTRTRSASSKSQSSSPSRIYQTSVGVNINRKTKSCVKPTQTQPWK